MSSASDKNHPVDHIKREKVMTYTDLIQPSLLGAYRTEAELYHALYTAALFDGKELYVGRFAQRAAFLNPDKTALIMGETSITFKHLYTRACALSTLLRTRGIQSGQRVLLWWDNSIEFFIAYYAVVQVGAVVAPLNVYLQQSEFEHILADATPSAVIISDQLYEKNSQALLEQKIIIRADDIKATAHATYDPDFQITDRPVHEMAVLLYTSGTTGLPKGVMTSSINIMTNVIQGITRIGLGIEKQERIFGILPLFHSFAQFTCVWGSFIVCATVIIVPRIERRYILEGLKHQPTIFLGVPALYGLLILMKHAPIDSVKYFVSGGDAMPDTIRGAFALVYGRKIVNGYGLTETTPLVAVQMEDVAVAAPVVGLLVHGMHARIIDEQGNQVAQGQIGELLVSGPNVMLGYYNEPEKTAQVLVNGWFHTGDLAYYDDQNRLVIAGRSKDLIVNKGIKIYPQEVEHVIMLHPEVIRAAVVGQTVSQGNQVPIAYVQSKSENVQKLEKELQEICFQRLARYKCPRSFIITTQQLPTTATGKIDKKKLHTITMHSPDQKS